MSEITPFRPITEKDITHVEYVRRHRTTQDRHTGIGYRGRGKEYDVHPSVARSIADYEFAMQTQLEGSDLIDEASLLPFDQEELNDLHEQALEDNARRDTVNELHEQALIEDHWRNILDALYEKSLDNEANLAKTFDAFLRLLSSSEQKIVMQILQDDPELAEQFDIDQDPLGLSELDSSNDLDFEQQLRQRGIMLRTRPVDVVRDYHGYAGDDEPLDASPMDGFLIRDRP